MKLTQRQVRRLIEAEVDKMRKPKGPNSRDDSGENLTEEFEQEDTAEDIAEQVGETFYELLLQHFSPQYLQRGALENARLRIQEAVHNELEKLV